MIKNSRSNKRPKKISDPYFYLSCGLIKQAVSDINCYLNNKGTVLEQMNGKIAMKWITEREGSFNLISTVFEDAPFNIPKETFHAMCINLIAELKTKQWRDIKMRLNHVVTSASYDTI